MTKYINLAETPGHAIEASPGRYVANWNGTPLTCEDSQFAKKFKDHKIAAKEMRKLKSEWPYEMRTAKVIRLRD